MKRARPLLALVAIAWVATGASPATAHTASNIVAVPAGSEATVTLKPTHGCDDSPTVEVRIRAPLEGAEAVPVDGWTETAEADDEGNTILTWTDGSLPADETGEFPITFTAPDTVGEVLTFPSIQDCENGEELAWIDGDPEAEFPAPRLLILDADAEPAETIDDVPLDAPGRDQLVEMIDIDNPVASSVPENTDVPMTESTDVTTTDG
jgi:uncharacterized protein YcnI